PLCKVCRRAVDWWFSNRGDDGGGLNPLGKDCPDWARGDGYVCDLCFEKDEGLLGSCVLGCGSLDPDCEPDDGCNHNGFCDCAEGETSETCPSDCGPSAVFGTPDRDQCDEPIAYCVPDGTCDAAAGETC